jgi:SAM-dependent methyltransferase
MAAVLPVLGVALLWAAAGVWGDLRLSPYKGLMQTLEVMGVRVLRQASSPLGLVTVVESPEVPLRHAPGLSLAAPGEPPEQLALFTDGEGMSAIVRDDGRREALAYLDYVTFAAPYHLVSAPRVLVLGAGTGTEVLQARFHGASSIDAVELMPDVVRMVQVEFGAFSGRPYSHPGVRLHVGEARGFVAATDATYDVLQIALMDAFGAASAGLYALSESYLYTVESLQAYLRRLAPGGVLSITRWVSLPPRGTLKLLGMAAVALERDGVADPGARIALLRSWNTATLLVKNGPFTPADIARVQAFCRERSFDLEWYPGIRPEEANRFNRLDDSWFHDGAVALLGPDRGAFVERYKFNLAPATDDRPYFFQFFRWRALPELWRLRAEGGLPLLEWGYPLVVATLLQALAASAVLILLPMWLVRRRPATPRAPAPWLATAAYFAAIGVAFMFVEMAFIQKFTLFLSHPLYAVAVVLFSFLVSAGVGSRLSERLAVRGTGRRALVAWPVAAIALLSAGYAAVFPSLLPPLAAWPDAGRIALSVALVFPLGLAMGMPFPLGMARLAAAAQRLVPWAWGVNACASVVSAVLATLLAIHLGFNAVLLLAVALYLAAAAAFPRLAPGCT